MAFSSSSDDALELAEILGRDIPWETYMSSRLISDNDLQLIRKYDKRSPEVQASLLDEDGPAYVEMFVSILKQVKKEETVQYMLALLVQMFQADASKAKLLRATPDTYTVLLKLLQRQDWFTQEKACKLLTVLLNSRTKDSVTLANGAQGTSHASPSSSTGSADAAEQVIASFIDWLTAQLRRPTNPSKSVPTAIGALAVLLRETTARQILLKAGGVQLLSPLLKTCNHPSYSQILYEICLCIWQLSFVDQAAEIMASAGRSAWSEGKRIGGDSNAVEKYLLLKNYFLRCLILNVYYQPYGCRGHMRGMVKGLVDVAKTAQKEKVFRVALGALRNLLGYEELGLAAEMVEAGLPKLLDSRSLQSWGDEEIIDMLDYMGQRLAHGIQVLSSFEKYKKEVLSGSLDWSPMHTSEVFWRNNADRFEEKDFQILRVLLKLIEASREVRTLAVGCSDLAQFITYHPHGRYIVSDLRGKELVMRLMQHPDPEVQKQALLCVQKIMLTKDKLDFLQSMSN